MKWTTSGINWDIMKNPKKIITQLGELSKSVGAMLAATSDDERYSPTAKYKTKQNVYQQLYKLEKLVEQFNFYKD